MPTPLGLLRGFKLRFPFFDDVRIVRAGPYRLHLYCLRSPNTQVNNSAIDEWLSHHCTAGTLVELMIVSEFPPDLIDDESLLETTSIKRILVEEANITGPGLIEALQRMFGTDVLGLSDENGDIVVTISSDVAGEHERQILQTTRLFLCADCRSLRAVRQPRPTQQPVTVTRGNLSALVREAIEMDRWNLEDCFPTLLVDPRYEPPLDEIPVGSLTYASGLDGVPSLHHRLALFERVYLSLPVREEDFPRWVGASLDEVVDALPGGRLVPVFSHPINRYEPKIVDCVLNSGVARSMLPGEIALRSLKRMLAEHPLLSEVMVLDSDAQRLRSQLEQSGTPAEANLKSYLDALVEVADRATGVALNGPSLGVAWHPLARWLDQILASRLGVPSYELELSAAIDHRLITEALGGTAMTVQGHYLDGHLRFVYGAYPGQSELVTIPKPDVVAQLAFPNSKGISLKDFAATFSGGPVKAMQELLRSARLSATTPESDIVKKFNEEALQYSRRADPMYTSVCLLLTVVGTFTLGIPMTVAGLSLELCRRVMGRRAPAMLASVASKMTHSTKEGVLVAQIKAGQ